MTTIYWTVNGNSVPIHIEGTEEEVREYLNMLLERGVDFLSAEKP